MCSVVEIKNDSEYYIYYHSPESLETVPSAKESLEYQHLFQVSTNSAEDSQHNSLIPPASQSSVQEKDGSEDKNDISSEKKTVLSSEDKDCLSSEDKDFSLEEMINYDSRDKTETGAVVDLEITQPTEEASNDDEDDDDDNPDTRTNNQQNCENQASVRMSSDRKLKGLYQLYKYSSLGWIM